MFRIERMFNMYNKKILGALLMSGILTLFTGCNNNSIEVKNDVSTKVGFQLEKPSDNEEIAIIETNKGKITVRFFPEEAPKAVENFKTLSKNGYYNNVTFHRVIKDFMIQGGDPDGTGKGGQSTWGSYFEDEFSPNLFNITGSLSMANMGPNTNGSQFFINNQNPEKFAGWKQFTIAYKAYKKNPDSFKNKYGGTVDMSLITDEIKELYIKNGGSPHLDGYFNTEKRGHTVFGQVIDGMDVVNNISQVDVDESSKPAEPVVIKSISIEKYSNK